MQFSIYGSLLINKKSDIIGATNMGIKNIIKNTPIINGLAKVFFDERREKKYQNKIRQFLQAPLPYVRDFPEKISLGHEPTIRCNLRCKMCYQGATRNLRQDELATEEIFDVYKKFNFIQQQNGDKSAVRGFTGEINPHTSPGMGVKEIKLVGGEPFMRSDILELIKFWDERKTPVSIQTNLTLLTESKVRELAKFKNIKAFLTSLDGPPDIHDLIRGVPGAFQKMVQSVKLIHKHMSWAEVSIFSTMLFGENDKYLYRVCEIAKELGIYSVQFLFEQYNSPEDILKTQNILAEVLGWDAAGYRINTQVKKGLLSGTSAPEIEKNLINLQKFGYKIKCFANFTPYNFYKNLEIYFGQRDNRIFCTKLLNPELRIIQTGDVVWCDIIEKSFGNLTKKSPQEIWLSADYQAFRSFLKENSLPICRRCCKAVYI